DGVNVTLDEEVDQLLRLGIAAVVDLLAGDLADVRDGSGSARGTYGPLVRVALEDLLLDHLVALVLGRVRVAELLRLGLALVADAAPAVVHGPAVDLALPELVAVLVQLRVDEANDVRHGLVRSQA